MTCIHKTITHYVKATRGIIYGNQTLPGHDLTSPDKHNNMFIIQIYIIWHTTLNNVLIIIFVYSRIKVTKEFTNHF